MRRTPLKARQPLTQRSALGRHTRMQQRRRDAVPRQSRQAVERRSGGVCERCRAARASEVHHRKMRSQGGGHEPANLAHLCGACHAYVHAHPAGAYLGGWLLKSWEVAS